MNSNMNHFMCFPITICPVQIFAEMIRKFSNTSNYLDNYSIYQKTQKSVFFILENRCENCNEFQ